MAHRGQEPGERGRPTKGPARRGAHGPARPSLKGAPARGIPGGVRLVHEDEDLIVVDKPPGLLTAGLPGQEIDSVFRYLKVHVRDQHKRRGTKVWIIHRLDKEASGLLVFAKTDRAYEFLKEEFRSRRAHRLYAAVVEGDMGGASQPSSEAAQDGVRRRVVQQPSGTIQSFLIEDEQGIVRSVAAATSSKARSYDKSGDHAKIAVTHWRVLAAGQGRTLLQVRLETGRKNQIRVHMQEAKHPIVGDRRYGAATDPIERVCLHAAELGFAHPATGQTVRYSSPVPRAFTSLVGRDSVVLQEEPTERKEPEKSKDGVKSPVKGLDNEAAKGAAALRDGAGKAAAPTKVDRLEPRAVSESWDHVAEWYAGLIEERKSDHHEQVILPGTVRLLRVEPGLRVLDVACGQGVLTHRVAALGAMAVGIDASPKLIEAARRGGSAGKPGAEPGVKFVVGDAREIAKLDLGEFDRAACVMALMNIEPMSAVLNGVAACLRQGGMFVGVVLHPAFRAPGQTSWGWDGETRNAERGARKSNASTPRSEFRAPRSEVTQYRRVDGYLSAGQSPIVMNPGEVARGRAPVTTVTFHRPIQTYINAFAKAGLLVDAMEEWPSLRMSQPGPRAAEENRARREIPMFLAIRGVKGSEGRPKADHSRLQ
jgi:23S rRNA pseudouridine1911/1915/1917 synthase